MLVHCNLPIRSIFVAIVVEDKMQINLNMPSCWPANPIIGSMHSVYMINILDDLLTFLHIFDNEIYKVIMNWYFNFSTLLRINENNCHHNVQMMLMAISYCLENVACVRKWLWFWAYLLLILILTTWFGRCTLCLL